MKLNLPVCAAVLIIFSGCASLTSSQLQAVNQFAKTSRNFSAYPSEIMASMAELRVKRGVYFVNSLDDPADMISNGSQDDDAADSGRLITVKQHIQELTDVYKAKLNDYKTVDKINISFRIIDKYAQSLLLLTAESHTADMQTQAASFGISLDSLIGIYNSLEGTQKVRSGIGGLIGSVIMAGGKQLIRSKQAKEIQRFVPAADEMIGVMTGNLLEFLKSGRINELISNEERGIQSNFRSFLLHRTPTLQNEWDYVDLLTHLDRVKSLRDETAKATKALRTAHTDLLNVIREKKTLTEVVASLQAFYDDVNEVRSTIHDLHAKN